MHRHFWSTLLVALMLSPGPAAAQDAATGLDAEAPFVETLNVEIVNIDAWVTDRQGRPVTGLTREDFVVKNDGKEVEITNFYAVEDGREQGAPEITVAAAAREPRLALAPEHRLWLIVYIDNFNLMPLHRKRVFPDIRQFLGRFLKDDDRAMVVSFDRALKVRQPFTGNAQLLRAALDEIEEDFGHAAVRATERKETLKRMVNAHRESQALGYALQYAENQMHQVGLTTRALQELIDSLAGLPGRKALLYVTSGVPLIAGEEMFQAVASLGSSSVAYSEIARHDTSRDFTRVGRHATANRVVFYTMDAGGLRGMMFGAAEYGMAPGLRSIMESTVIENQQASLRLLAEETGGRAILNRNEILPALIEASDDFRTFYSLGIANPHIDEGRFHKIKVEVRKGLRVRHRKGYRSQGIESRIADSVRSALLYGYQENPLGVSAQWGRPRRDSNSKNYILPVQITVPVANVVLLPTFEDRYEMRLKLYSGVADEHGDISEIDSIPLGLRIAEEHLEAARGESFVYTHRLLIEEGLQKIALAVFDRFGNQSSIICRSVTAGE